MEDKMTQEEVDDLRSSQKKLFDSRLDLGDVQVAISRLETRKKSLVFDIETQSATFTQLQNGLTEKYGNKKVNLETGELT